MTRFFASQPIEVLWRIDSCAMKAAELQAKKGPETPIPDSHRKELITFLESLNEFATALSLESARSRILLCKTVLSASEVPFYYPVVCSELDGIKYAIEDELSKRQAVLIPRSKVDFCEQEKLFGEAVHDIFPEARADIKDAGNCLAVESHTGAVFHLMRVAEFGLRRLAQSVGVTGIRHISHETWGRVIDAIGAKLGSAQRLKKGPRKEKALQFYGLMLLEIKAFKDLWRNPVMHTRTRYNEAQAESAFQHVRAFMQRLTEKR